jgi:UDP-glucose 4-epimerase
MANYLVTGAAGFIGSAVANSLLQKNNIVVTIDNLSTGYLENVPKGAIFIEGDCGNALVYDKVPKLAFDAIIHIAGQSSGEISFDDPVYDIKTNAESTLLLLKFALQNNCKRFIYAGTMSVYGEKPDNPISESSSCKPESFYGVAKLASEHYMRIYQKYGINSTSLRLFNVYGPGQNLDNLRQGMVSIFLAQMLNNNHILVKGLPDRYRDFIHIDNVVDVFNKCIESSDSWGLNINVATGIKTSVAELIELMCKLYNRSVSIEYSGSTEGDIHGIYADTTLMNKVFKKLDVISLEDGLQEMLIWIQSKN